MTFMGYPFIENVEMDQNIGFLQKTPSPKMSKKILLMAVGTMLLRGVGSSLTLTVITNVSKKSFFQDDMKAGTSTDLFQNNKICTTLRSKICNDDVHVLDLFPIFTPLLKFCAS